MTYYLQKTSKLYKYAPEVTESIVIKKGKTIFKNCIQYNSPLTYFPNSNALVLFLFMYKVLNYRRKVTNLHLLCYRALCDFCTCHYLYRE